MSAFDHAAGTVRRPRSASVALVGVPLLAALLGAVLALVFGSDAGTAPHRAPPPPAAGVVAAGDLRLTLPDGWTPARTNPQIPGFAGARATFARSGGADIAIALLPAVSPSLLPEPLDRTKGSTSARPSVARGAGAVRAYHYVRAAAGERVLDVIVAPTTQGVATVACASTVVAPGECELALSALRLARGSFLSLSADAGFLTRLPAVVATLDAQRARLRTRLARASLPEGAARTAVRLAGAYASAADALRPLAAPRGESARTLRLLDALRTRYGRLAGALRAPDRGAFAASAHAIARYESQLAAQLEGWQRMLPLASPGRR
jgi:hypothetical protein